MPIATLVIVLLAGAAVTSWLIDREALRQTVVSQIRAATGVDLVVNGGTEISLFPGSYITLRQVALKGNHVGGEPLVVADLTANLRLLPLLAQHFEIADLTLSQPVISVVREGDNDTNWSPIIEALAKIMKPGFHSQVSFSEIRIKDGILAYRDPMQQIDEQVSGIDISLAWPSISRSFAATGQFDWHGERIDGSLSIADSSRRCPAKGRG